MPLNDPPSFCRSGDCPHQRLYPIDLYRDGKAVDTVYACANQQLCEHVQRLTIQHVMALLLGSGDDE